MQISYLILDGDITYQYLKDGRRKMITYIYLVDLFALIEIISSLLKILQSSKRSLSKYENIKRHRF